MLNETFSVIFKHRERGLLTRGNPSFVEGWERDYQSRLEREEEKMTHCTSFFQMSSGRKAKFSTATTSSGTNGMLFLPAEHLGHQLQYHCSRDRNYLHSQLSISEASVQCWPFYRRMNESGFWGYLILHSTSLLLYYYYVPHGSHLEISSQWRNSHRYTVIHGVWKSQKKYHSTLRAKPATFTFCEWIKSWLKMPKKRSILASFWNPEAFCQTVLPDMSVLIGQNLMENARIQMRHFE